MGNDRFTEHAQNLLGCEKHNLRKAVGILEIPFGCEISVIVQEGLITCYNSVIYQFNLVISTRRTNISPAFLRFHFSHPSRF